MPEACGDSLEITRRRENPIGPDQAADLESQRKESGEVNQTEFL